MRVYIAFMVESHGDDWEIIGVYSSKKIAIDRLIATGGKLLSEATGDVGIVDNAIVKFFEKYYVYVQPMEVDGDEDAIVQKKIEEGDWQ
jgi:hypothetical protein